MDGSFAIAMWMCDEISFSFSYKEKGVSLAPPYLVCGKTQMRKIQCYLNVIGASVRNCEEAFSWKSHFLILRWTMEWQLITH